MKKIILLLPRFLYELCYQVGLFLVRTWYYSQRKFWQKVRGFRGLRPGFTLVAFIVLAGVISSGFHLASLVASGQDWKGQVLGQADQGLGYLSGAQASLANQDINGANQQLALALRSFEQS